jgi:hypothetical protein
MQFELVRLDTTGVSRVGFFNFNLPGTQSHGDTTDVSRVECQRYEMATTQIDRPPDLGRWCPAHNRRRM